MSDYQISEQDIKGMLHYLEVFHPENANRDFAIEMLEYTKASIHRIAMTDHDALDKLYESFNKDKK